MTVLAMLLAALNCLVAAVWASRHYMIGRERREAFALTGDYPGPPTHPPKVSVLVAAKDEEQHIETCLRTMLAQDYPDFEMIVCNDRSTDRTGEIARAIAAEDSRVRLVNVERLPDGWCGKNNAMRVGAGLAKGEWLCLTDADCRQTSTRTLSAAVQYATDTGAGLLSVLPVLDMRGFWENVVQPVCSGVMMIWFHPDKVNDPRRSNAYANGAFMLMKRSVYDAVGGHEAVKDRVNEDIHLAARVKRAGLNLRVVRSNGLYAVRMYTSLKGIYRGWTRIFFGTFGTLRRVAASLAAMILMGILPYAAAATGMTAWATGCGPARWWLACGLTGLAAVAVQLSVMWRFYRLINARPQLAWTYLLGALVAMASLVTAMTRFRKSARLVWRGTSYRPPPSAR